MLSSDRSGAPQLWYGGLSATPINHLTSMTDTQLHCIASRSERLRGRRGSASAATPYRRRKCQPRPLISTLNFAYTTMTDTQLRPHVLYIASRRKAWLSEPIVVRRRRTAVESGTDLPDPLRRPCRYCSPFAAKYRDQPYTSGDS